MSEDELGAPRMSRRIAAFFDMDRTLLHCNTGTEWVRFQRKSGKMSAWKMLRAMAWIARYKLSILDFEAVAAIAIADLTGQPEKDMIAEARRFFDEYVVPSIAPRAHDALAFHRREGHVIAILSSSTPYVTEPLAERLGIEHVLCTRLRVEEGRFTGLHVAPACAGAGKIHWAERFAEEHEIDLAASWFYTDSYSDLPMLLRVGVQKVINPDTRLARHARRAGWEPEEW